MIGDAARPVVYDGHCHVPSTRFIPRRFVEDVAENMHRRLSAEGIGQDAARWADALLAQNQDHNADRLVAEMDAAGVARSVLLVPDFSARMDCELPLAEMARLHHEIRLRHPGRFWVYIGADPRRGEAGVSAFERMVVDYGFDGLKLYPPCGYSPSDPRLYPYYEVCRDRQLPVFVHTGPTARTLDFEPAHPLALDQAARDFPGVNFVIGHGGVTHIEVSAYLADYRPNVYVDIGGFAGTAHPGGWAAHLNRLFRLGINHKIIFGTDWPLNRMSGGLKRLVATLVEERGALDGVRQREQRLILSGNLVRVLAPRSRPAAAVS
jgi:predicted TIM-barrel fold metal-dependent hydrolase